MEIINTLCSIIVGIIALVGIPASIIWLIVASVKKQSKDVPKKLLIGCLAGLVVFSIIGSTAWQKTDDYDEYLVEKEEQERQEALANAQKEQEKANAIERENIEAQTIVSEPETEPQTEPIETELNMDELTEEEYKAMCEVAYIEDFEQEKMQDGQFVKMQVSTRSRYAYERYDMFGCIIDDLIEEYDLENEYFEVGLTSREHTTIGERPVYGGTVYLLFDKQNSISMDDYERMDAAIVYGEVVQMWSGPFVIPRYMEVVDRYVDNLREDTYH